MIFNLPGTGPDLKQAIERYLRQKLSFPWRLWTVATASLPTASADNEGALLYDETTNRPAYSDASNWVGLQPYDAALASLAGLSIVQGDLIYGDGTDSLNRLAKNTTATRYLSNTGTSNNPAWAQVNLANGVTGDLPFANLTQGSALSVLGVTGNATADVASIAAANDAEVLRRSGTTLAFGTVATAGIADDAVTFAKFQNITSSRVLGRTTASSGNVEELGITGSGSVVFATSPTVTGGSFTGLTALSVTVASNKTGSYVDVTTSGISDFSTGGVGFALSRPTDGVANLVGFYSYQSSGGTTNLAIAARGQLAFATGGGGLATAAVDRMMLTDSALNLRSGVALQVNATQVVTARQTGWGAATGTATRTAIATYTAPTISSPPTQAEVQAIADALQAWSRRVKATTDDLATHGLIGA